MDKIFPRPFLLQHGEKDSSVPVETQALFFEEAIKYYGDLKDRIAFTRVANLNHHKTIGMVEESLNWLNKIFG